MNVVKGLRLLVTVVDVGVTADDLTVIFAEDKINSLPGVAEFIDSWNTFSSYIGFLSFGADNLVNGINKAPDVATSVTNKYRQFQKTYKDNPAKLVEVIGEANLQKVEKIVDDLEAAVKQAGGESKIIVNDFETETFWDNYIANVGAGGITRKEFLLGKGFDKLTDVELTDLYKLTSKTEIKSSTIKMLTGEQANLEFKVAEMKAGKLEKDIKPPYDISVNVEDLKLNEKSYFVRVHLPGREAGAWVISVEDFKKMKDASEIKDLTALWVKTEDLGKLEFSLVELQPGAVLRRGKAGKINEPGFEWGNGGATQFEILDFDYKNPNNIKYFKNIGKISSK